MKKIALFIVMAILAVGMANAKAANQLKVYINPGHGSWGSEDRNMRLVNKGLNDTTGFYESNTNIRKGLALYQKLRSYGLVANGNGRDLSQNVVMSHVRCNPAFPAASSDGTYSRALSVIATEAQNFGADMFISVHSNATSDGTSTNYPLILYRGTDSEDRSSGSKAMGRAVWPYAYGNGNQVWSHYSLTNMNIRGDVSYMGGDYSTTINGVTYYGYYGVLRHGIPGFLIEGYFHTYQPSRHRAMNWDVDYIEGYNYARGIADYFSVPKESTGDIYGLVRSADEQSSTLGQYYTPKANTDDTYLPLNGATVTLKNSGGTTLATYTTDGFYNGAFVFKDIAPGTYTVTASKSGYVSQTKTVVVTAATTNYCNFTDGTHNFKLSIDTGGGGGGGGGNVTIDYTGMTTHNPFAYDVTTYTAPRGVSVSYKLTGRPTSVVVELYKDNNLVKSVNGNITAGTNTVFIPMVGLTAGTYKAKVKVTGNAVTSPTRVKDGNNNEISYRFYAPWGVSCNNDTESATFGRVAFVESHLMGSTISSSEQTRVKNYHSAPSSWGGSGRGIGMGVYFFTPTFSPITISNNTYGTMAGMTAAESSMCNSGLDLRRVKYTDDGRLFVGRGNMSNSSVWEINADGNARQLFQGSGEYFNKENENGGGGYMYTSSAKTTFVAGPVMGFDFVGSGSNLKMVIVTHNIQGINNNYRSRVDVYNLGTKTVWFQAPSKNIMSNQYWINNTPNVAVSNSLIYVTQHRGTPSSEQPSHVVYDLSSGNLLQVAGPISAGGMTAPGAGVAFDKTRTKLAIVRGAQTIRIYQPNSNGGLGSELRTITNAVSEGYINALAWDYADNLYITSNDEEIVRCYALPRDNNTVTTPARATYDINWSDADVYLLGNFEGKSFLPSNGTKMNYNSTSKTYTLEGNLTNSGDGYAYFSFSHALSSSWDQTMADNRFGAEADGNFEVYDQYLDTPLSLKYWANDSRAFKIPPGNYRLSVNFTDSDNPKLTITKLSYNVEAWQPSANYTVDEPVLLGTRAYTDGNRGIGVSNGLIYTMHQRIDASATSNWQGFFGGINRDGTNFTATQSSNISGSETYMIDFTAASDDYGNLVFGAVNKTSSAPNNAMIATGGGQGMDRFMIMPATGGGIGNASIDANQSVTFGISGSAIPDRTQLMRATGDFTSSQGGYIWLLPHDASVIWKGGYKNVTTSGGTAIDGTLIYTGFTSDSSPLHSANPYGEDGLMLSVRGRGICDGKVVGSRYQSNIVSSNQRYTRGHPSMFIIQDHKLLVCCTGEDMASNLGLFDITNDANGTYSMSQIGSDMVPFSSNVTSSYTRGTMTKAIPVDDLTWDIYGYSNGRGFSQYRIHLSPVPVTAGSGSVSNNGTSQSKTITWTKGSGTTPAGYNVEVSTDGGTTWTMAASADDVTTESWTDTDTSRATLDCKYRISAVYDSYTSTERHASAPCAVISVNAQRPTKAVGGVVVTFNPLIGTSTYNSTADLVGLEGSLSWTRPKSIASDSQSFPATSTGDYGFGITGYRITVTGSDSSYATDESGNSLNAFTVAATGAMASDNLSMTLKNMKRGVTYTATVEPVYSYLPTSAASYGTSAASAGSTWNYTPEAVQNFTVNTYVQRNAPFNEWWTDHTQTVYYDIYRVEITLDGPEAAGVPVSYYKLEVSRNNGSTWEPITDRPYEVASGQSGATSTTYPSYDGMPAGCWHGNHDFSVRTKPDAGFANNVNVGFYHFVVKGLSPAAPYSISPRAAEEPTPDEWQYRVTTYYGSSPSATYAGQTVTPDAAGAGSSSSVVITEVSDPTITSVEPIGIQPVAVKVYPNPTQGALNILSPEPIETIRIVSISGALMRKFDGNRLNSMSVDIADLGHGNYFVIVNALKPVAIIRN